MAIIDRHQSPELNLELYFFPPVVLCSRCIESLQFSPAINPFCRTEWNETRAGSARTRGPGLELDLVPIKEKYIFYI